PPEELTSLFGRICLEVCAKAGLTVLRGTSRDLPDQELAMDLNLGQQLAALARMTVSELRTRYACVFGEPTAARHKTWLIRRIAWRLQARAEGDLSERARRRAAELANDADLRLLPPRHVKTPVSEAATLACQRDPRLPPPGTILARPYKGQTLQVK